MCLLLQWQLLKKRKSEFMQGQKQVKYPLLLLLGHINDEN